MTYDYKNYKIQSNNNYLDPNELKQGPEHILQIAICLGIVSSGKLLFGQVDLDKCLAAENRVLCLFWSFRVGC